jgi:hypothetical protein
MFTNGDALHATVQPASVRTPLAERSPCHPYPWDRFD